MELESTTTLKQVDDYEPKGQAPKEKAAGQRLLRISNTLLILSVVITLISLSVFYRKNTQLQQDRLRLISNFQKISAALVGTASAQVGDLLPSFDTTDSGGARASVVYDGKSKYLFLIFSTQCGECISEFLTWRRIAPEVSSRSYRVVGLSMYSEERGKEKEGAADQNFQVLRIPSTAIQRAYRVTAVPMVMIVSAEGKVTWVHYGKLSEEEIKELLSKIEGEKQ